jgi:hypothetical protein
MVTALEQGQDFGTYDHNRTSSESVVGHQENTGFLLDEMNSSKNSPRINVGNPE